MICHKADLRFVSISGQKVLDSVQGALEQAAGSEPALSSLQELVSHKLQDSNHRYTTLHTKVSCAAFSSCFSVETKLTAVWFQSTELGGRLSGLLERYQQYQDQVVSLHSWLSAHEQNQSVAKSSGDTDPQDLQSALRQVQVEKSKPEVQRGEGARVLNLFLFLQLLQDELAERSVQLEKVQRAGRDLVSTTESPSLKAVDILCAAGDFMDLSPHFSFQFSALKQPVFLLRVSADGLEKRFSSLSASVSERAEQLQTAVAQSVSVQEGLKALLGWLDQLVSHPGPVEPTSQALQEALTQNQVRTGPEETDSSEKS